MKLMNMKKYCPKCYYGARTMEEVRVANGHQYCSANLDNWNGLCAYQKISYHMLWSILQDEKRKLYHDKSDEKSDEKFRDKQVEIEAYERAIVSGRI